MQVIPMKIMQVLGLVVVLFVGAATMTGCKTEGCTDPMSDNYDPDADENDGTCIPWRDKFLGTFSGTLGCDADPAEDGTFQVTASGTSETGLVVTVGDYFFLANVTDQFELTIPNQKVTIDATEYDLSGSGLISGSNNENLEMTYTFSIGMLSSTCTIDAVKL
jgi:hypothetical protein